MRDLDFVYIDRPEQFREALRELEAAPALGIDTEADSLYRYRERVCFLQIGIGERAFLIDTLAVRELDGLRPIFESPDRVKIFHGADYDVASLFRDFGFTFTNVFDTMLAAQILGREQLGLAALVREFFGVDLDKSLTRHDWGRRPLDPPYIRYLAEDVIFLAELRRNLTRELRAHDVEEEASIEFGRVARLATPREPFDPEGFRDIKGARDLDHDGLSILRELYLLRDRLAREADRPPFKVLLNQTMIDAAARKPRDLSELRRIPGFNDSVVRRVGDLVLRAIADGLRNRAGLVFRLPRQGQRPPDEQLACGEALKEWRRATAERDRRTTLAVLPNHLIARLAEIRPMTREQLAAVPHLGARRVERYGDEILAVVANPGKPRHPRSGRRR